mmetsp:Transcript_13646/g.26054  ORF Transcript_13646/g.26054 Transcript_13646/m.26054 type:complete len:169 (-) Transcript_13646:339-845(-)
MRPLAILLVAAAVSAGWMKSKSRPNPNPQKESTSNPASEATFVQRINNTHAFVSDYDEEMRDILHRIRKKATGKETLSQEAALLQVERIRKKTGNTFFDPVVKAERFVDVNKQQRVKDQEKINQKLQEPINADNLKERLSTVLNQNSWMVQTPDMMPNADIDIQAVYI